MTLRKPESEKKYCEYKNTASFAECPLCREGLSPIKKFKYWILISNRFPYDLIASKHDMLMLKDHKIDITIREYAELLEIKDQLGFQYDAMIENMLSGMSIPAHYHCHLIKYK